MSQEMLAVTSIRNYVRKVQRQRARSGQAIRGSGRGKRFCGMARLERAVSLAEHAGHRFVTG
jgi:hypothetical protein